MSFNRRLEKRPNKNFSAKTNNANKDYKEYIELTSSETEKFEGKIVLYVQKY